MPDFDTGLQSDDACPTAPSKSAVYLQNVTGDKGNHIPTAPNWWISPDIGLNPGTAFDGIAKKGQANVIRVRPHVSAGCTVNSPIGDHTIRVDLYVCGPSATPWGPGATSVHQIGTANINQFDGAGNAQVDDSGVLTTADHFLAMADWTPAPVDPTDADDPQNAGHRCLIARAYPRGANVDTSRFHQPDDPHYCQRNIEIQVVSGVKAEGGHGIAEALLPDRRTKLWHAKVRIANLNREERAVTPLRLAWDPKPNQVLQRQINAALKKVKHPVKGIGGPPKKLQVRPKDLPRGTDVQQFDVHGEVPQYMAFPVMRPGEERFVTAQFDLHHLKKGELAVFHANHMGDNGVPVGGFTWAFVMA